jgi:anti-sigma B factor antagonist
MPTVWMVMAGYVTAGSRGASKPRSTRGCSSTVTLGIQTEQRGDGVVVVVVHGEVDIRTAPDLRDCLAEVLDGGARRVVLDLSGVDFLDSTALSVMVGAHKRLSKKGDPLTVVAATEPVQRVLSVTGLSRVFEVHGSRDDAMHS